MSAEGLSRRRVVQLLAATPLADVSWSSRDLAEAWRGVTAARRASPGGQFEPEFFTGHEYRTVGVLVDLILPADERSGSPTELGVPEFMDFMMIDRPTMQPWMRGGLAWLDFECQDRFDARFVDCDDAQRRELLDDIAWPEQAPDELRHGAAFFSRFRDLTASGFWTTEEGMRDLGYMGNRYLATWNGCPEEVLEHLGLDASPGGDR